MELKVESIQMNTSAHLTQGTWENELGAAPPIYSPVGTRPAVCRPPRCRRRPTARSVPSRTSETRRAPPPRRPHAPPTTSPACLASRSRSSASWCPACRGRPPAHAFPAETHKVAHHTSGRREVVRRLQSTLIKNKLTLHVLLSEGKHQHCVGASLVNMEEL